MVLKSCACVFLDLYSNSQVTFVFCIRRLVDDRMVVEPAGGDLDNPPKKFRGTSCFAIELYCNTKIRHLCIRTSFFHGSLL